MRYLLILLMLAIPALVQAKTVYLSDGSTLEARSVWVEKGKVKVLTNKESLVEFNKKEVNMKKTFSKKKYKKNKKYKKHRKSKD